MIETSYKVISEETGDALTFSCGEQLIHIEAVTDHGSECWSFTRDEAVQMADVLAKLTLK